MDMSFANQALAGEYINNNHKNMPPNVYTLQKPVEPMAKSNKIVYNSTNSNFIADNTKPQSNVYNPRGVL